MKKNMTVKEFGRRAVESIDRLKNSINKKDKETTERLLYIAALDRLESDADYRSVKNNPDTPAHVKERYARRREKETIMDIEGEVMNGIC